MDEKIIGFIPRLMHISTNMHYTIAITDKRLIILNRDWEMFHEKGRIKRDIDSLINEAKSHTSINHDSVTECSLTDIGEHFFRVKIIGFNEEGKEIKFKATIMPKTRECHPVGFTIRRKSEFHSVNAIRAEELLRTVLKDKVLGSYHIKSRKEVMEHYNDYIKNKSKKSLEKVVKDMESINQELSWRINSENKSEDIEEEIEILKGALIKLGNRKEELFDILEDFKSNPG